MFDESSGVVSVTLVVDLDPGSPDPMQRTFSGSVAVRNVVVRDG